MDEEWGQKKQKQLSHYSVCISTSSKPPLPPKLLLLRATFIWEESMQVSSRQSYGCNRTKSGTHPVEKI